MGHVCTRIKIHFIAYYNSHTQALSRHSDTIAIDKESLLLQTAFSCSPLTCGTRDISGCVQNISQNQPVHPVAMQVSVMIAISLLYLCCKSYMATIKHKKPIILLIFQTCISRNPGMCLHSQFSKIRSHIVTPSYYLDYVFPTH